MHVSNRGRRLRRHGLSIVTAVAGASALVAGQAAAAAAATGAPASAAPQALFGPMTPALAASLSQNVNQHVIVIM